MKKLKVTYIDNGMIKEVILLSSSWWSIGSEMNNAGIYDLDKVLEIKVIPSETTDRTIGI
jgi:hypothetical protein